jgi:hypothetical protein
MDRDTFSRAEPNDDERELTSRYGRRVAQLVAGLKAEAAVSDVTFALDLPGQEPAVRIEVDDIPPPTGSELGHAVRFGRVDAAFFDVFEIPLKFPAFSLQLPAEISRQRQHCPRARWLAACRWLDGRLNVVSSSARSLQRCRLKNCTARSCFSAAARVRNVPRLRRRPVRGSTFREYRRYSPDFSLRIIVSSLASDMSSAVQARPSSSHPWEPPRRLRRSVHQPLRRRLP